jgi:hypothetical protein
MTLFEAPYLLKFSFMMPGAEGCLTVWIGTEVVVQ